MCYRACMDFNELVALLREPGEDGLPETIYDDLTLSYNDAVEGGASRLAESEATNASLVAEVARLKALNFDLLMAASGETSDEDENDDNDDSNGTPSIESLFEKG